MLSKFAHVFLFPVVAITVIATASNGFAQESGGAVAPATNDPAAEIEAVVQSYVTTFNARDAAKLAAHWAPEGVYTSRSTGEQVVGREAMTAEFTSMFAGESVPDLAVATESIDFISPNVALERGIATVTHAEDDVVETSYSVVYVKQGGAWLIDRVTEDELVIEFSNRDKLAPLEWMIGKWVDEIEGSTIEFTCQWTRNQNFISRKYEVVTSDGVESSGLQIIGWDPVNNQIRSWLFDSDGSFVSGKWTQSDDKWVVQSIATLADGAQGSYTSVFRPQDDGNFTWQKINRILDGELLPNIDEVVVQRK